MNFKLILFILIFIMGIGLCSPSWLDNRNPQEQQIRAFVAHAFD